jgi:hypothetical protein
MFSAETQRDKERKELSHARREDIKERILSIVIKLLKRERFKRERCRI